MSLRNRMLRQDRVILEGLEEKYGKEAVANAIMLIANNGSDVEEQTVSPQEAVLDYIMYLEGLRIRLREIHWACERKSTHLLTDEIISGAESLEDAIAEDLMGICGFRIKVGCIVPKITMLVDLGEVLDEFSNATLQLCASLENDERFTGIVNELDDVMHDIGKWKYLATFK